MTLQLRTPCLYLSDVMGHNGTTDVSQEAGPVERTSTGALVSDVSWIMQIMSISIDWMAGRTASLRCFVRVRT